MDIDYSKGRFSKIMIRWMCFIILGVTALYSPLIGFNVYSIILGLFFGLLFGFLYKLFLRVFLSLFNHKLKKEKGKVCIRYAIDWGMVFMVPFILMLLIATFYLNWTETRSLISAGIMGVGTAAAIELGKIRGKQEIKNTIATSGVSFLFSLIWTFSFPYLQKAPLYLEGGIGFLQKLIQEGGGLF